MSEEANKPQKKGGALKWILIGCLSIAVLGAVAIGVIIYMVSQSITTDPAKVEEMAQGMFPMETPAGMTGQFGLNMMGVGVAAFGSSKDISVGKALVIMTFPAAGSKEDMKRQMRESMSQQGQQQDHGKQVDQRTEKFTIRGQEVEGEMIIYEKGEGESATRTAQVFIVTESSEGKPVMVMFLGPEGEVTKDYVQANLSTVK